MSCSFRLRKKGPKELVHEPISAFHVFFLGNDNAV